METLFSIFRVNHWGEFWWIMVGFVGQALFSTRFLIQWIMSERARQSVMPVAFWYFSLGGGIVLLRGRDAVTNEVVRANGGDMGVGGIIGLEGCNVTVNQPSELRTNGGTGGSNTIRASGRATIRGKLLAGGLKGPMNYYKAYIASVNLPDHKGVFVVCAACICDLNCEQHYPRKSGTSKCLHCSLPLHRTSSASRPWGRW